MERVPWMFQYGMNLACRLVDYPNENLRPCEGARTHSCRCLCLSLWHNIFVQWQETACNGLVTCAEKVIFMPRGNGFWLIGRLKVKLTIPVSKRQNQHHLKISSSSQQKWDRNPNLIDIWIHCLSRLGKYSFLSMASLNELNILRCNIQNAY